MLAREGRAARGSGAAALRGAALLTHLPLRSRQRVSGRRASHHIDAKTPAAGVEQRAIVKVVMQTWPHVGTSACGHVRM